MRSSEPTDVPPHFWPTRATGLTRAKRLAAAAGAVNAVRSSADMPSSAPSTAAYLIETLVTLSLVCALAVLVLWVARRAGIGQPTGPIELRGHLPLDARRSIYLVAVGERVFVVGVGEGGFTKLGDMPASDVPRTEAAGGETFGGVLARALRRRV